jgi:transaldolase
MIAAAEQSAKTGESVNTKESLMKFFLDTANLNEIREGVSLGLVDGITTNPSLVAKEGGIDFKQHVAAICELVAGDVSAEVTSLETEGMLREGREYAAIAPNVVVKCPLTTDGLRATRQLTSEGIRVKVTLCFSPAQAAKAGAAYISPFIGRLDDIGQNGLELVRDIVEIYNNYRWKTEVLAASIRHPIHVIETARAGADVATMPFKVMQQLIKHPLTDKGLDQFLADWRKSVSSKPVQNVNPLKEVVNVRQ